MFVAVYGVDRVRGGRLRAARDAGAGRDPAALQLRRMIGNWTMALRSRRLVGFLLINTFATCGLFAFLTGSAFVFVEGLEAGERGYAFYFGIVMLGNFIGAWLARRIVIRIGLERVIARGTVLLVVAGVSMAALAWIGVRHPLAVTLPMLVFMLAYMWTVPQATAGALTPFPQIAGSIASLMSFTQFVMAAGFAYVVGVAYDGTPRPMATAIAVAALAALASYRGAGRYSRRDELRQLAHVDRARAFLDRGTVARDHRLALLDERRERGLEPRGVERAPAAVVLLRELPDRPGRRERHARARGLATDRAAHAAEHAAERAAQELARELLEVLAGEADAQRRDELLDVTLVELVAVRLADPVDEPHLQRQDRHRRERLG